MNPTKERVLQEAQENPQAADVLRKLFPAYFDAEIDLKVLNSGSNTLFSENRFKQSNLPLDFILVRSLGEYSNRAFFLSDRINWELKKDSHGSLLLIPTRKD